MISEITLILALLPSSPFYSCIRQKQNSKGNNYYNIISPLLKKCGFS